MRNAVSKRRNGSIGIAKLAHGVGERDEDRMVRRPGVAGLELALPGIETGERAGRIGLLVGEIVGGAREGVDRRDVAPQVPRQQARAEREVLVVRARDALALA